MAETVSSIVNYSMGNLRGHKLKVTMAANSNTADVPTNVGKIAFAVVNPIDGAAYPSMRYNSGVAGTSIAGVLSLASATSGKVYTVVAFGPTGVA